MSTPSAFVGQRHDFDFLVGRWNVTSRRLRARLAGCTDWDEDAAHSRGWTHLDGLVSVDEIHFPRQGFSGCTVRTLDLEQRRWSIYWINSLSGTLFPPVHGGFAGERGEFYGDDVDAGRAVKVRFVWTRDGLDAARWEQAFALAGGAWEVNWVMEFARVID